ncbi:MAG: hypothetical protein JXD18_08875 [Anaerolineae bacterium]|nr:hypothetical protein [Anaerolineae bacterium]
MNQPPRVDVQIEDIATEHLPGVAALHRRVFPDYFLTHLGQDFLERFYGEFVARPGNYGLVMERLARNARIPELHHLLSQTTSSHPQEKDTAL